MVILHNDMDMPLAKQKTPPVYLTQMKDLLRRHPGTTIIWAHIGLGRIVRPVGYGSPTTGERHPTHIRIVEEILRDPALSHVYFDISWDEVAKSIAKVAYESNRTVREVAAEISGLDQKTLEDLLDPKKA